MVMNDCAIMVKVVRLKRFTEKEVIAINRVRISLQVIFILDLVKQASNVVRSYYRKGKKDSNQQSTYKWPNTILFKQDRKVWEKMVILIADTRGFLFDQLSFNREY